MVHAPSGVLARALPLTLLAALLVLGPPGPALAQAPHGGPVVIATASDLFRIANPAVFRLSSIVYWQNLVMSGLAKLDDSLEPVPDLAESWSVADGGRTYTFKLRQGVTWHDGQPFTADDVKFTYELLLHPKNPAGASHFPYFKRILGAEAYRKGEAKAVEGVQVLGPLELRVRLPVPYGPFLTIIATQPIVPRHILGSVPVDQMIKHEFTHKPIGTGPYTFVSWKNRETAVLRSNPTYWGQRPRIDEVVWRTVPDPFTALAELRTGKLHVNGLYAGVPVDELETLGKDACCKAVRMPGQVSWFLDLNHRNPMFEDVRVRRAISYAIDRKTIVKTLFKGWGTIANSPFHPTSWAYKKDVTLYDGDPEAARRLLDEAGWKPGPDGVRVKDGRRLSFTWRVVTGRDSATMAEAAVPMLRAVGIEARLERQDFQTLWFKHYTKGDFEAVSHLIATSIYAADPDYELARYYNHTTSPNGYHNPRAEALIEQGATTLDRAERKKIYDEFQEIVAEDAARLWLAVPDERWGVARDLSMPELSTGFVRIQALGRWQWER